MTNPYIDTCSFKLSRYRTQVGLSVVIREQHLGFDNLCCTYQLIGRHRIRLVTRQESNVDILNLRHLRDILGIAGNIDTQAIDGKDIAIIAPLGVELLASGSGVVQPQR